MGAWRERMIVKLMGHPIEVPNPVFSSIFCLNEKTALGSAPFGRTVQSFARCFYSVQKINPFAKIKQLVFAKVLRAHFLSL